MIFQRELSKALLRLAKHFPAVALIGARQAGKTTLLRLVFHDYNYVSLDVPAQAELADKDPTSFLEQHKPPLIVDEVQYAPKLFRHLKSVIDRDREKNGQFILTGSQKFGLMKEVSDSLAGRIAILELENLSIKELGQVAKKYLKNQSAAALISRGMFPHLWKDQILRPEDFYSSYFATYLERDVRQIVNVSSLRDFDRFMRACALRSGQLLNKSELARDVGVTAITVNEWLGVLHASNQIILLEPYFANISKRLAKSPKLYFADTGLLCFLLGLNASTLQSSQHIGSVWETFVFSEMRKYIADTPQASLWFYRDRLREVDFILDLGGSLQLFECKWKEVLEKKDATALVKVGEVLDRTVSKNIICRTPTAYPVMEGVKAINGFTLSRTFLSQDI